VELKQKLQQTIVNAVETQEQARILVAAMLERLRSHLEDENLPVSSQLEILKGTADCMQLLGKANETSIKSIRAIEQTEEEGDGEDSHAPETSADDILREITGRTSKH